jgi:hypothetical protein
VPPSTHDGEHAATVRWTARGLPGGAGVLGQVPGKQPFFVLALREEEEDDRGADQDRGDAGGVRPVGAVEERLLGSGGDLGRVLRILLRGLLGTCEGPRQLACSAAMLSWI